MSINTNPLKQYFRRPAVYIRLPSEGKFYTPDVYTKTDTGEFPVYPMTAIDEITAKTPDALFTGQALIDIIKSCIPAIKDPWKINNLDIDAILLAIRTASQEGGVEIISKCPECSTETKYNLDTSKLLAGIKPADYSEPIRVGELEIFFKPMTYKEMTDTAMIQFNIQKKFLEVDALLDVEEKSKKTKTLLLEIAQATMNTLATSIVGINTPNGTSVTEKEYIIEYLKNCETSIFDTIRDMNIKYKQQSKLKPMKYKCPNCQHEYSQDISLDISDFFG